MTYPPMRFYSIRRGAPCPQPAPRHGIRNSAAVPLCTPGLDATALGLDLRSPFGWALTRTADGMRVGWLRGTRGGRIDWQEPDELGNVYHPEGPAIFDGFPIGRVTRAGKIIVPGRGVQFANVKSDRPGFIEIITGWTFHGDPDWWLMTGGPTNRPLSPAVSAWNGLFQPWYAGGLFPTVYQIREEHMGQVVFFPLGAPMAMLVPLPASVWRGIAADERRVESSGVAEWPTELTDGAVRIWNTVYDTVHPGRYAATAHRERRRAECPARERSSEFWPARELARIRARGTQPTERIDR